MPSTTINILARRCERHIENGFKNIRFEFEDFEPCSDDSVRIEMKRLINEHPDYNVTIENMTRTSGAYAIKIIMSKIN